MQMASDYLQNNSIISPPSSFPLRTQTKYADDWDFLNEDKADEAKLEENLQPALAEFNLRENPNKRERYSFEQGRED